MKIKSSLYNLFIALLVLVSCGKSDEEKKEIAIIACNIVQAEFSASNRIKELNSARESVKQERFLLSDSVIQEAIKFEICPDLILENDRDFLTLLIQEKEKREIEKVERAITIFSEFMSNSFDGMSCIEYQENWESFDVAEFDDYDFESNWGLNATSEEPDQLSDDELTLIVRSFEKEDAFKKLLDFRLEFLNLRASKCKLNVEALRGIEDFHQRSLMGLKKYFNSRNTANK